MATAASIVEVQKAYIAYYGRPADPAGLDYWANRVDAEGGIDSLIGQFGNSAEATARFGSLSQSDAIDAIYQQAFGRDAEAAGKSFYLAGLLSGDFTLVTLARDIIGGATGSDATVSAAKLTAAQAFADYLTANAEANAAYVGDNAAGNARNWLDEVTSEATATAQAAAIAETIATISEAPSNPGSTFTLTSKATDLFSLTTRDDVISGARNGHLQTGDSVNDNTTTDNDVLTAIVNSQTAPSPTLKNIEVLNINGEFLVTGFDLNLVTGSNELNVNTGLSGGVATITNASTLSVSEINAGANLTGLSVTSSTSGTRDSLTVNVGAAASASIVGNTGVDSYILNLASGATAQLGTLATTGDNVTINNVDASSITVKGSSSVQKLTINASGALTVRVDGPSGLASGTTVTGTGPVIFDLRSSTSILDGAGDSIISDTSDITLKISAGIGWTDNTGAGTAHLATVLADVVDFAAVGTTANGSAANVFLNADSLFRLSADLATATTVGVGSGAQGLTDDGLGTLRLEVKQNQTGDISTHASVGVLSLSAGSGHTASKTGGVAISKLNLNDETNVVSFTGDNRITVTLASAAQTDVIYNAINLNDRLTLTVTTATSVLTGSGASSVTATDSTGALTFTGGAGADTVLGSNSANDTISGGAGNDVLIGAGGNDRLSGGAGDDIIAGGAGTNTLTGGEGSDTFRLVDGTDLITDLTKGVDLIQLEAAAASGTFDLTNLTVTASNGNGVYTLGALTTTLVGQTGVDLSDTIQLGRNAGNAFDVAAGVTATIVGGVFNDFVDVANKAGGASAAVTLRLGAGSDTLVLDVTAGTSTSATTFADFVSGTDNIVLVGSAHAALSVYAMAYDTLSGALGTSGVIAGSAYLVLKNSDAAISDSTSISLAQSMQLGYSGRIADSTGSVGTNSLKLAATGTYKGGVQSDVVYFVTAGSVYSIKEVGATDWIGGSAASLLEVRFDELSGMSAAVSARAADAPKVADTVSGTTYVFASAADGAGSTSLQYIGRGSGSSASLTDVATFLDAQLGGTTGEKLVAVVNDSSGSSAYAYYIDNTDGQIEADDLDLIAIFAFSTMVTTNFSS
jgi:S-layer protein